MRAGDRRRQARENQDTDRNRNGGARSWFASHFTEKSEAKPAVATASAGQCSRLNALGGEHEKQRQSDKTETQRRKEMQAAGQLAQSAGQSGLTHQIRPRPQRKVYHSAVQLN